MPGIEWSSLVPFLTLGLLGTAHCLGMCGGFAVALSTASGPGRLRVLAHQLLYVAGKALTYAVLGLVVARAGELVVSGGTGLLGGDQDTLAHTQLVFAWLAGGTMVVLGLVAWRGKGSGLFSAQGASGKGSGKSWLGGLALRLSGLFAAARALPGGSGALATGLVTGLLPCGWSWGALALAATTDPLTAFAGMGLFGLGTAPVLVLVGLGWSGLSLRFRRLGGAILGPLLVVFGVLTVARGASLFGLEAAAAEVLPDCCAESAEHEHESGAVETP